MPPHGRRACRPRRHRRRWRPCADALDTLLFGGDRHAARLRPGRRQRQGVRAGHAGRPACARRMLIYSRNVALLSLIISLITAALVFCAINRMMIRPDPRHDAAHAGLRRGAGRSRPRSSGPSDRDDEIGVAERELAGMQTRIAADAGRAEAPGRSRPRRLQDQPRHAQHPGLRATDVGPAAHGARTRPCRPSRRSWCARSTAPSPIPRACSPMAARRRRRPSRRRLRLRQLVDDVARNARHRARQRHRVRQRGRPRPSRSTPMPTSCSACSPISAAMPSRRWRPTRRERRGAPADHLGRARHGSVAASCVDRHRPRPAAARRAKTCSPPSAARRAAAAPASAWPSPRNWCAPMAARSSWWRARRPHHLRHHHPRPAGPRSTRRAGRCAARPEPPRLRPTCIMPAITQHAFFSKWRLLFAPVQSAR